RVVYTKYQFRILRVADFQRELEEYTGRSWAEFFNNWLYGSGGCDWAVDRVEVKPASGPGSTSSCVCVMLSQRAELTEPTGLGVKLNDKKGPSDLRIPIRPGPIPEEVVDPPCRVETLPDGKTVLVTMHLPKEPVQISVDPDQALLDKNPSNNHWKCEP